MRFTHLLVSVALGFGSAAALATPAPNAVLRPPVGMLGLGEASASSQAVDLEAIVRDIASASRRAERDMLDKLQVRTAIAVSVELDGVTVEQSPATFAAVPVRVAATALVRRW